MLQERNIYIFVLGALMLQSLHSPRDFFSQEMIIVLLKIVIELGNIHSKNNEINWAEEVAK